MNRAGGGSPAAVAAGGEFHGRAFQLRAELLIARIQLGNITVGAAVYRMIDAIERPLQRIRAGKWRARGRRGRYFDDGGWRRGGGTTTGAGRRSS